MKFIPKVTMQNICGINNVPKKIKIPDNILAFFYKFTTFFNFFADPGNDLWTAFGQFFYTPLYNQSTNLAPNNHKKSWI